MPNALPTAALFALLLPAHAALATPPTTPLPTEEERMAAGCRVAGTMAVAKVRFVRTQVFDDGATYTASVRVLRMLRGDRARMPAELSEFHPAPMPTDSEPPVMYDGKTYLMLFDAPAMPGWRLLVPQWTYGDRFDALVARCAAGWPEQNS